MVHDAILARKNPVKELAPYTDRPDKVVRAALTNEQLTDRNEEVFTRLGMVETAPYQALLDALKAKKWVPANNGEYKEVPDHAIRRQAANDVLLLTGRHAKNKVNIAVNAGAGGVGVSISFGDVINEISLVATDEEKFALYDQIKQGVRRGEITSQIIEGEFEDTTEPIGAMTPYEQERQRVAAEYDKLPEDKLR